MKQKAVFWGKKKWSGLTKFYQDCWKKHITNLSFKTTDTTIDPADIERTIRKQYKQLYMQNFDNLREMDQLLEKYKLPQLAQIK